MVHANTNQHLFEPRALTPEPPAQRGLADGQCACCRMGGPVLAGVFADQAAQSANESTWRDGRKTLATLGQSRKQIHRAVAQALVAHRLGCQAFKQMRKRGGKVFIERDVSDVSGRAGCLRCHGAKPIKGLEQLECQRQKDGAKALFRAAGRFAQTALVLASTSSREAAVPTLTLPTPS